MKCKNCGVNNPENARYCLQCGSKLVSGNEDTVVFRKGEMKGSEDSDLYEKYQYKGEDEPETNTRDSQYHSDLGYYEDINSSERFIDEEEEKGNVRRFGLFKKESERKFRRTVPKNTEENEEDEILDRDSEKDSVRKRGRKVRNFFLVFLTILVAASSFFVLRFVSYKKNQQEAKRKYESYVASEGHSEEDYKDMLKDFISLNEKLSKDFKSASSKEGRISLKQRIEGMSFNGYVDSAINAVMGLGDYDNIKGSFSQLSLLYNVLEQHSFPGNINGYINSVQSNQSELSGLITGGSFSNDAEYFNYLMETYKDDIKSLKNTYNNYFKKDE